MKKRILSVVLSMIVFCGALAAYTPNTTKAAMPAEYTYFEETFHTEGQFDELWDSYLVNLSTWAECVANDKFVLAGDCTSALYLKAADEELQTKTDYSVSCDVKFANTPSALTNISIVVRATNANSNGYEMQLTVNADGSTSLALRDRSVGKYFVKGVALDSEFDCTNDNTLKFTCKGTVLQCYVNGNLCITYDTAKNQAYADGATISKEYSAGTAALRVARTTGNGADITFDNFVVRHVEECAFYDDFNGYDGSATNANKKLALNRNGWYIANNVSAQWINGENYCMSAEFDRQTTVLQTENVSGASDWENYSVEADVKIGEGTLQSALVVSVTGRHSVAGGTDGYEIQLYETVDGIQQLRIYARNGGKELAAREFSFERGRVYNLKAIFYKDMIYAYVDDVLYLTATNDIYLKGFAGIRRNTGGSACGVEVTFDNFVVYENPVLYKEDFDGSNYDSVKLANNGWGAKDEDTLERYASYVTDGAFTVPKGLSAETAVDMSLKNSPFRVRNGVIEYELKFASLSTTPAVETTVYVSCRETANDSGYGLQIKTSKANTIRWVNIVKNGTVVATTGSLPNGDRVPFENMPVTVRLEFNEREIVGYIKGLEEATTLRYTIPDTETVATGYIGIHTGATTYDVKIDNLTVSGVVEKEETAEEETKFVSQVILNIGANEFQRNVNWLTKTDMDCELQYGLQSEMVEGAFPEQYQTVKVTKKTNTSTNMITHKATITQLTQNTQYVYRIVSGEQVSELYYFQTEDMSDGYTFAFMGDPQVGRVENDEVGWEETLNDLKQNCDVDFILSLGDEVHKPTVTNYGNFVSDSLAGLTTATVIGNHDWLSMYNDFFNLPNESTSYGVTAPGGDYWFVYGNTLFMCLNSNNLSTAEHIAFMQEAIAANPDVVWKTVSLHHCLYSVSIHGEDENVLQLREELVPAFTQLDVDVVLMGHDHCYTRTYMMDGFVPDTSQGVQSSVTDPSGILYITANSASGSKYNNVKYASASYAAVGNQSQRRTFSVVDVTDTKYSIITYYADTMTVMDEFTIFKTVQEEEFKIASASLTLQTNLNLNYKVKASLFENGGYENPYMTFEMDGTMTTVDKYQVVDDLYVFRFENITPDHMGANIKATLHAKKNGVNVYVEKEYSIAQYCYSLLEKCSDEQNAELRTLLVDLLEYGAMSQKYTGYDQDNLVNALLTDEQSAWGTSSVPTLHNSLNKEHVTVTNPTVVWKGAGLNLTNSIALRFKFETEQVEKLAFKVTDGTNTWDIGATDIVPAGETNVYYIYFEQLNVSQMRKLFYVTAYQDGIAISNTLAYNVESYAYVIQQESVDEKLIALVNAMMNYGNSAYNYVN